MDLDSDGTNDIITGSWPGELYVFKGSKGEGGACTYAKPTQIQDKEGNPLNTGKASAVFASDWDRDGDLDLVVGSIDGWVWFVENESGGKALAFGKAVKVEADGAPIHEHHSGPTIADWDGNGTLDLVVGQGDGKVVWYSNANRKGAPDLGAAQVLVEANKGRPDGSRCGNRVKPHVCDFNGDGALDLLLGDFSMAPPKPLELTDEQTKKRDELQGAVAALQQQMRPLYDKVTRAVMAELGIEVTGEGQAGVREAFQSMTDEQRQAYSTKMQAAMAENEEIKAVQTKMRALQQELRPLVPRAQVNGNVWVLLREQANPTTGQ